MGNWYRVCEEQDRKHGVYANSWADASEVASIGRFASRGTMIIQEVPLDSSGDPIDDRAVDIALLRW